MNCLKFLFYYGVEEVVDLVEVECCCVFEERVGWVYFKGLYVFVGIWFV